MPQYLKIGIVARESEGLYLDSLALLGWISKKNYKNADRLTAF
jgi:hypothetical protein